MRVAIFTAALLFALPAAAQSDSFSRGLNDGYNAVYPKTLDPMSAYRSGYEQGRWQADDEDDAFRRAGQDWDTRFQQRQDDQRAAEQSGKSCYSSPNPDLPLSCH
jgi:hypothetical protein